MKVFFSGEGELAAHPEDLIGPKVNIMMTFWLTFCRKKKGIQPRFQRLVDARRKAAKKKNENL